MALCSARKTMRISAVVTGILFAACAGDDARPAAMRSAPATEAQAASNVAQAEAALQAAIEKGVTMGAPSIVAAVATRDGVLWTGAAGVRNLQSGEPARLNDYYGIGSITKPFISVIIHQLADEGVLNLAATPEEILGAALVGDIANADTATVSQLMGHISGIPSWEEDPVWCRKGRGDQMQIGYLFAKEETLDYVRGKDKHPAVNAPGEAYSYSNTNFTLLGLMVEKVTGRDLSDLLHERIYSPLDLKDVRLEGFEDIDPDRLPRRYHFDSERYRAELGFHADFEPVKGAILPLVDVTGSNMSHEWAAGGMLATAEDLAKFGVALMNGDLLSEEGQRRILKFRPHKNSEVTSVSPGLFRTLQEDGSAWVGHRGGAFGYNAHMTWVEGEDLLIVIMTNMGTIHSGGRHITKYAPEMAFMPAARELVAALKN